MDGSAAAVPLAVIAGQPCYAPPQDLYIPPDALRVLLERFEGPLDLLLYLIRRQNIDILDIPIASITEQYMNYIELMQRFELDLAGEYLVMAAILAEIKSRMLLPRPVSEEEEEDPRADLARRILEYERYRRAAEDLGRLERMERDTCAAVVEFPDLRRVRTPPAVTLEELLRAFAEVLTRTELYRRHRVRFNELSVRERMATLIERLAPDRRVALAELLVAGEGRAGLVVTLLALLELLRESTIECIQDKPYGPIHVVAA